MFFISSATPLLPPPQVLKGESAVPSLQQPRDKATNSVCVQTHTHRGDIQPCFQHLLSKAPGVVSLKKTWGWNLTPLLALCRLEPSSCHCGRHYWRVSNGGLANVSHSLGTSPSPPALSDWGAIYLSASTSAPSLPNPSSHEGPGLPWRALAATSLPKSIKKRAVKSTWMAKRQVSALNGCNHPLTGTGPDKLHSYYGVRVSVLTVRACDSDRQQQAEKQVWVYSCISTHTHDTINCTSTARNSNYRGFNQAFKKPHVGVWVVKTSLQPLTHSTWMASVNSGHAGSGGR